MGREAEGQHNRRGQAVDSVPSSSPPMMFVAAPDCLLPGAQATEQGEKQIPQVPPPNPFDPDETLPVRMKPAQRPGRKSVLPRQEAVSDSTRLPRPHLSSPLPIGPACRQHHETFSY